MKIVTEPCDAYTGTDNLEAMSKAVHYNTFLVDLVYSYLRSETMALDFGAGLGDFALALKSRGLSVVGLDTEAAHRAAMLERGLRPISSLAEIEEGSLDAVYTLNVLEHIQDDYKVVAELAVKIRKNGLLFIYVPAHSSLFTAMDAKVGHFRRYSRNELVRLLTSNGFYIEASGYVDSLGVIATLLYKVFGSRKGDLGYTSIVFYDRFGFPLSQLIDRLLRHRFGKNAYAVGVKM
jgi:SAM-dependent methyltransferase